MTTQDIERTQGIPEMDEKELQALMKAEKAAEKENEEEWKPERKKLVEQRREIGKEEAASALDRLLAKAEKYTQFLNRKLMTVANEAKSPVKVKANGSNKRKRGNDNGPVTKRVKAEEPNGKDFEAHPEQPKIMVGGRLRDYQIQGYKWMVGLYENGLHGILADEMGLGKTVQTIALLAHLREKGVYGPILLVVPLSTVTNWIAEIEKWVPSMPVLMYHGSKEDRQAMRKKYLKTRSQNRNMAKFPVCVTTYEIVCRDRKDIQGCGWKYIIVDEGHRLKNFKCRLIRELNELSRGSVLLGGANKILLTGTPLQNNLTELWSLLNFLMPEIFDDLDFFQSVFAFDGVGNDDAEKAMIEKQQRGNIVSKLHKILAPFMMRRLKTEVEKNLPSKKEIVVYTPMTEMQKGMYESIVNGELAKLLEAATGNKSALNNIMMQLRKCSLHPYLHYEPTNESGNHITDESLVEASGKLKLLDQMLADFKKNGHKVLIFSQFTTMLDIIQDYLSMLRSQYKFCRIDGGTALESRKQQMHDFNNDPEHFVFLLSTRAGGVGINLVSADTVIIFDSDWNPHQDNQAQDRAHRIGQKRDVAVYRLITAESVELKILDRANSKRKLERVVCAKQATINGSNNKSKALKTDELRNLLRNDFTGHLGEVGRINSKTIVPLLNREKVFSEGFPQKGDGYEIVKHKAAAIVGSVNS
mmetsp:Transcript_22992/g.29369  ORF Transcript_22992/g.29369 Transcript_22992/m.29369 type:complete len:699 (+) Transcript_22992:194-2290(+)|eukprot:CAMPEP_0204870970 /NCGR_PEP_ID=MMETSP1348-20121228/34196_1 /ASSEMBLY_ACC=CAM_ASM_000700 /TAXON_ID=215587 /ORGANISM="Aplanochytrium stocchinoi, Strain GSBS06" /LENGTH=698 /DNA_ID=CAMNT_0052025069 /DNA_START=104 /DNA_END=2200 /DNA_ORIENTATION=-